MTKRQKILDFWDGGLKDKREIARLTESSRQAVRQVLSTNGRTEGRMTNGPDAYIWPKIKKLWDEGERDLVKIAGLAGSSSPAAVRSALNKRGFSSAGARSAASGFMCRVPALMVDHARERGVSPAKLAQRILDTVATDQLYTAVLDDGAVSREIG